MSSEKPSKNSKGALVILWICAVIVVMCAATVIVGLQRQYEVDEYQAALQIDNWTNLTLNITVYVYNSSWDKVSFTLAPGQNVTVTITWTGDGKALAFIHSVGPGVYNTQLYTMYPGQWRTVVLI